MELELFGLQEWKWPKLWHSGELGSNGPIHRATLLAIPLVGSWARSYKIINATSLCPTGECSSPVGWDGAQHGV